MTADKVLGLSLRGTDLVVLSACQTGVRNAGTGVGGYTNTSLDLVSDLVGAVMAIIIIRVKRL